jgi:hypothetical protein
MMTEPAPVVTLPVAIIQLLGQLAWPTAVLIIVHRFHKQLEGLLGRVASIKLGGSEWVFQEGVIKPPTVTPTNLTPTIGPDGFLTIESLRMFVAQSGLLDKEEEGVRKELLIFQTPKQRTWLLATKNFTFVLLDDEHTRAKNKLVQTLFEKKKALPLAFGADKGAGIVKFGAEETWWYYSFQLFPDTSRLQKAVERLLI